MILKDVLLIVHIRKKAALNYSLKRHTSKSWLVMCFSICGTNTHVLNIWCTMYNIP